MTVQELSALELHGPQVLKGNHAVIYFVRAMPLLNRRVSSMTQSIAGMMQ
jgi:hypothetical protein